MILGGLRLTVSYTISLATFSNKNAAKATAFYPKSEKYL